MNSQMKTIPRARSRRIRSARALVFEELGCIALLERLCSPTQKLSEPRSLGVFMEASSCRHDGILTQPLALLPSLKFGEVEVPTL